jgi:hypothetical protein
MIQENTVVTSQYVIHHCRNCNRNSYRLRSVEASDHKCQNCLGIKVQTHEGLNK